MDNYILWGKKPQPNNIIHLLIFQSLLITITEHEIVY